MEILTGKKKAARWISTLALSGLLSACGVMLSPIPQALDPNAEPEVDTSNTVDIMAETQIAGCEITLSEPYLWRDWQPTVAKPGSDGGSPLRASVLLLIINRGDSKRSIAWEGYLEDVTGMRYLLRFTDRSQTPQHSITLAPGGVYQGDLVAHEGPYLPVGSSASVKFHFEIDGDHTGHLSAGTVSVDRTD